MKKLLFIIMLVTGISFAQDVNTQLRTNFYSYTMTATKDTIQLKLVQPSEYVTIAVSSSGTDTLRVYTKTPANTWMQQSVVGLHDQVLYTEMIVTSTLREYIIRDPEIKDIRLVCPDVTATMPIVVQLKRNNK